MNANLIFDDNYYEDNFLIINTKPNNFYELPIYPKNIDENISKNTNSFRWINKTYSIISHEEFYKQLNIKGI